MEPLLPKKAGTCDECGDKLIVREDDSERVISQRMKEYDTKTSPLLKEYQKRNVLTSYEAKKGVKDYPELKRIVLQQLEKKA